MKLSRQTLIYFGLGAILLYMGGDFVMKNFVDAPFEARQSRKEQLEKKIKSKKKELVEAKSAAKKLASWETQSLPKEPEVARSLYRSWLLELLEKAEFQTPHVDSGPVASKKGFYDTLSFTVRGRGTLDQVTQFLYAFYKAGHLHKIQAISLTPVGKSGGLDVTLAIEALILPGTDRKDQLSLETSTALAHAALADYRIISQRNLFGAGGESDPSRQVFLTAVTNDVEGPEVWFTLRAQDKLLKLHKGEEFQIGSYSGKIVDILQDDVIFESVGDRWILSIGETLADAFALPPEF